MIRELRAAYARECPEAIRDAEERLSASECYDMATAVLKLASALHVIDDLASWAPPAAEEGAIRAKRSLATVVEFLASRRPDGAEVAREAQAFFGN